MMLDSWVKVDKIPGSPKIELIFITLFYLCFVSPLLGLR